MRAECQRDGSKQPQLVTTNPTISRETGKCTCVFYFTSACTAAIIFEPNTNNEDQFTDITHTIRCGNFSVKSKSNNIKLYQRQLFFDRVAIATSITDVLPNECVTTPEPFYFVPQCRFTQLIVSLFAALHKLKHKLTLQQAQGAELHSINSLCKR